MCCISRLRRQRFPHLILSYLYKTELLGIGIFPPLYGFK